MLLRCYLPQCGTMPASQSGAPFAGYVILLPACFSGSPNMVPGLQSASRYHDTARSALRVLPNRLHPGSGRSGPARSVSRAHPSQDRS